jgi:hypothetical protein
MKQLFFSILFILGLSLPMGLQSCVGLRSDPVSISNVADISKMLPDLLSKAATSSFKDNESAVNGLTTKITNAYEHAKGIKKNNEIAEQWRVLRDELVQPFVINWKDKGKLDKDFVTQFVKQIKDALASIERAEKSKRK